MENSHTMTSAISSLYKIARWTWNVNVGLTLWLARETYELAKNPWSAWIAIVVLGEVWLLRLAGLF